MTAPPRLPHWRKLSCRPITAAVCQVHHLTQNALQKLHVCTHLCTHSIVAGSICSKIHTYIYILFIFYFLSYNRSYKSVNNLFALYVFSPDPLHDGLSSSHTVLGHSPGLVQGGRDTDGTSVEYNKENKRSHSDRGKTVSA